MAAEALPRIWERETAAPAPVLSIETAAHELWKLDVDTGHVWPEGPYTPQLRDRYIRRVLTVLRWSGVAYETPAEFKTSGKGPGSCARGYCRSQPACKPGFCAAVC